MITTTITHCNTYPALADVSLKTVTNTHARTPEESKVTYAMGLDRPEWFVCRIDSHGNICDADGIVVFPSESGRYPARRGDTGYFGEFRDSYPDTPEYRHLPSVHDDVYHTKSKRGSENA